MHVERAGGIEGQAARSAGGIENGDRAATVAAAIDHNAAAAGRCGLDSDVGACIEGGIDLVVADAGRTGRVKNAPAQRPRGTVHHRNIGRVKQPFAVASMGGGGQHAGTGQIQGLLARGFDKATVAAQRTTVGADAAVHARGVVRPHHHGSAIAGLDCVGLDGDARCYVRETGVRYVRVVAMHAAADQHSAAASGAGGINAGLVQQSNVVGFDGDGSASGSTGVEACVALHRGVSGGLQKNVSAFADGTAGIDGARIGDQGTGNADGSGAA